MRVMLATKRWKITRCQPPDRGGGYRSKHTKHEAQQTFPSDLGGGRDSRDLSEYFNIRRRKSPNLHQFTLCGLSLAPDFLELSQSCSDFALVALCSFPQIIHCSDRLDEKLLSDFDFCDSFVDSLDRILLWIERNGGVIR
ncbi:MAG: hypothetical protein KDI37_12745 [Xanthomonadales bacterium]|nr:hypothetical protein [Xanthomonadales bacterium]